MGKSKHGKNYRHKLKCASNGSIQVPCQEDNIESELGCSNSDVILNIVEEVQSANVEEKLCGLQSLAALTEKPEFADTIIRHKVLKIICPLMIDKNSEIRNLTAGVLRNLSANGSVEIIERLVKDDVMTPLMALLQQYNDWKPESSKAEDKDTLLQVVNVLWNLCENDETALKYFTSANLLNVLLRCLDYQTVGLDLCIAVCQCLNSVSEDNAAVITALRSHGPALLATLTVQTAGDNRLLLLKVLIAGIVMNINLSSEWLASVLAVVSEALTEDIRPAVSQLSSQLPLGIAADATPLPADVQTTLESIQARTEAQTMALEILTNLTANIDDEMDVESEESASEGEGEVNGWKEQDEMIGLCVMPEVDEALEKFKLVPDVINKIESLPENVMDIISSCPNSRNLAKRIIRLQCRAFLCFNNLVSTVDLDQLGGPHRLYSLIKHITSQRLCLQSANNGANTELVEASTAAIRAILLRLASMKFTDLGEVFPNDLEVMFKIGLSPELRVKANVIRVVGTLGVLLINNPLLVKMAGNYLLESAESQTALWLTAEALDSLMDMFAEDSTDMVAVEISLVARLQAIAPRLKAKMRQERRHLGEHYAVVSTVMTNLTPFIKYKEARVTALLKSAK